MGGNATRRVADVTVLTNSKMMRMEKEKMMLKSSKNA